MRFLLALALLPAWIGAAADPVILTETPLGSDRCEVIATAKTDDAGKPLKESQWYASDWRCEGYQGRFVYLAYGDGREGVAFGSGQSAPTHHLWHHRFGAWGPSVEWRGSPAGNAAQAPLAAIARYSWDVQLGNEGTPPDIGADLAVISVGDGGEDSCIVAWWTPSPIRTRSSLPESAPTRHCPGPPASPTGSRNGLASSVPSGRSKPHPARVERR